MVAAVKPYKPIVASHSFQTDLKFHISNLNYNTTEIYNPAIDQAQKMDGGLISESIDFRVISVLNITRIQ